MPEASTDRETKLRTFCTYFDSNYLDRGLCLWASLSRFCPRFRLFVCCFDAKALATMKALALPNVVPISLESVERHYPDLLKVKPTRNRAEYFFTMTPSWTRYVFDTNESVEQVTYLDSDLLFFSSPEVLFDAMEAAKANIGIIAHRFTPELQHAAVHGVYNVGWVTFGRAGCGMTCLLDWQRRCIEWCFDKLDGDRFADQKYLNAWPTTYKDVLVLNHAGANVALWNLERGCIVKSRGRIEVYGVPLIFYHFHGLSQISRRSFLTNASIYNIELDWLVRTRLYGRYMLMLRSAQVLLKSSDIAPLIRFPQETEDVRATARSFLSGNRLISWQIPRRSLEGISKL